MKKIRVLHIIKSLGRGGAEMLLPETLALHNQAIFEFHYIYFLPWKNQMVSSIQKNGGKVTCIPASNNIKIILAVNKIADYIKKNNIEVVHAHLPWAGIVARLAGKKTGIPVIYTEHNKWERYHRLTFALNKFTFGLQRLAIPVSEEVERSIKKYFKQSHPEIITVLNGVNVNKFKRNASGNSIRIPLNISDAAIVIGTVSVFRIQKRLIKWLEIAAAIHKIHPETYFIIVGDGLLKEEIYAKAKELKMDGYLHFAGLQEDVRPYFNAMDAFMMTSEFEGLPIALLEAMSMECVAFCTRAGGIGEVITDNINGFLVDVNEPEELVNKVDEWIKFSNDKKRILKAAARERIKEGFSMNRMVAELEEIYKKVL